MKNKRGFTLVELLAVIVILAVILIIAVPKITDVINNTKKSSFEDSARLIVTQAEKQWLINQASGSTENITCSSISKYNESDYENCNLNIDDNGNATITLVGKGKFENNVCNGTKDEIVCEKSEKYVVTFDPDGGTVETNKKEVLYHGLYGELPVPEKEGYTFLGWNGKNMFDEEKLLMAISGAKYENGYYVFGTAKAYSKYGNSLPISNFKENTRYAYSISGYIDGTNTNGLVTSINYNDGTSKTIKLNKNDHKLYTAVTRENSTIDKIRFTYGTNNLVHISYIQLEEGIAATEYEPYYIKSNTKVVQEKDHILTAIWKENT